MKSIALSVRRRIFAVLVGGLAIGGMECSAASEPPNRPEFWIPLQTPATQYVINVKIDLTNRSLSGTETIRLENKSRQPLSRLILEIPGFDAKELKVSIKDQSVKVKGTGNGLPLSRGWIDLSEPLKTGESAALDIQFEHSIPSEKKVLKLADWHPRLWWGHDSTDDYEVKIDAPKEYAIAASGVFEQEKNLYSAKGLRSFGIVLLQNYEMIKARAGETDIFCYCDEPSRKCAETILQTAVDVIDFYRNWLGFYPHKILHIVPGEISHPAGGYPIASAIVGVHGEEQFESAPESHWRFITAHEIGHQYWMEHVLQAPDAFWLMIGLGVYADRAFMQAKGYGDLHERDMIRRYIAGVREGLDTRMDRSAEEADRVDFDYNNIVVHGKGFGFISALAYSLGKETFESAYKRCLEEYRGRPLAPSDFQRVCEEESGHRLDWFFDPWIHTSQYLSYEIASQDIQEKDSGFEITENVRRKGKLRISIPVAAYFQDGSTQCQNTNPLLDESALAFVSKSPLKEIKLDPLGELPLVNPPPNSKIDDLFDEVSKLNWTGDGDKALKIFSQIKNFETDDLDLLFKLAMCLYDEKYYEESLKAFEKCAELGEKKDTKRYFIGSVWMGHLLDLTKQREKALACYRQALQSGYGGSFRHDQYGIKVDRAWIEERLRIPFHRD
ncbi:MAG: M1 family aminopeptidase [Candidatus Omnitrophota bacterium]